MPQRVLKRDWWHSHGVQVFFAYVLIVLTLLLLLGTFNKAQNNSNTLHQIQKERAARTAAFCMDRHQQQVDKRNAAVDGYLRLPQFKEFFNDPNGRLAQAALDDLRRGFREENSNSRIPAYCPQSKWPERTVEQVLRDRKAVLNERAKPAT